MSVNDDEQRLRDNLVAHISWAKDLTESGSLDAAIRQLTCALEVTDRLLEMPKDIK